MPMPAGRSKRGASNRRLELLAKLRPLLRARTEPERMLRSVASLLAVEIGQYCIADVVGPRGALERLEIEHADPSKRARLRVACEDARLEPGGRVSTLAASGGGELASGVTDGPKARALGDIHLLEGERIRSYMAATVSVHDKPFAVLSLVVTSGIRRYDEADLAFLVAVADWTGLGIENARREAAPNPMGAEEAQTAVRRTNPLRAGRAASR